MATRLRKKIISKARTGLTTLLAAGSANYQTDSDPQKEVSQKEGRGAEKGEIPRATLAKGELFFFPGRERSGTMTLKLIYQERESWPSEEKTCRQISAATEGFGFFTHSFLHPPTPW